MQSFWLRAAGAAALAIGLNNWAGGTLISSFPAGQGGWQLGTLAVGNLDADPDLEIIVPYRAPDGAWYLDAFKWTGERLPGFPFRGGDRPINASPTLYDLDGDGRQEILFTCGNEVIALRGDGSRLWSTPVTVRTYIPDAGYQTVTGGFYWSGDRQFHPTLPDNAQFFSEVSPPLVADVNGNGSLQVITAWKINPDPSGANQDFNPFIKPLFGFGDWGLVGENWSGGVVLMGARTGRQEFVYHFHQLVESGLGLGRPDNRPSLLTYVLNDSDSVVAFDKTLPFGLFGNGMLHQQFGKNQRLMSGSYLKGVDIYPVDLDGDGKSEVLVPTTQWDPLWQPHETVLDDGGAILWREWKQPAALINSNGWLNSACMIPVNPDHDNHVDVLTFSHSSELHFRFWDGANLVERAGWPKDFSPYLPTPPVVGDIDGDGEEEIIVGTYDPAKVPSNGNLYVFALDGRLKYEISVPGGLKHIPALADVNNDGSLDVVYRSLAGRVYIQNFGAGPNAGVSWATHRGNMQRDGNWNRSLFPPGTPLITDRSAGYRAAHFSWIVPGGPQPDFYRIFRAESAAGPYQALISIGPGQTQFTDAGLGTGQLSWYEIGAVYGGKMVLSAPFSVLPFYSGNLAANPGFEENDNSHWDKWFTGDIPWTNMTGTGAAAYHGDRAMEIRLQENRSGSSIKQFNQYGIPRSFIPVTPGKLYSFGGFFRSDGFSQPSAHWWEWNSSATAESTNQRPALPWPDFFTPPLSIGTDGIAWTYANRVFQMPAGFPNVELRHRFWTQSPASGAIDLDDVFFRELPNSGDASWQILLPFGAAWKYWTNQPPPKDWASLEFNDSLWPVGWAKFGQGSVPTNVTTLLPANLAQYFFRGQFAVPDAGIQDLLLGATCTDNFGGKIYPLELYLNGKPVLTSGIEAVTGDGNGVRYFDLTPFIDQLRSGDNTIAFILNNAWEKGWDNVAFDVQLQAITSQPVLPRVRFDSIRALPEDAVTLVISGLAGSRWILERSTDPHSVGGWQPLTHFTLRNPPKISWTDAAPESGAGKIRYYRLRPE